MYNFYKGLHVNIQTAESPKKKKTTDNDEDKKTTVKGRTI